MAVCKAMFQWGHDFTVMDRSLFDDAFSILIRFQSSHDFAVMDRAQVFWPLQLLAK